MIENRTDHRPLAIVLGGGGARAAYQVGLLRCLGRHMPDLSFQIISGVSAGAINAVYLAAHRGSLRHAAHDLSALWSNLHANDIFRTGTLSIARIVLGWGIRLVSGGNAFAPKSASGRALLDSTPLRKLLEREYRVNNGEISGIAKNLDDGRLEALALSTLDYATGQTVTWVQGCDIDDWLRPHRRSAECHFTVDHVMASAALPLIFPAVRLGRGWHGDGGVRLTAPLSPVLHLGASRILAVSTRHERSLPGSEESAAPDYPPPAQILGHVMNAIFLDLFDQDVSRVEVMNRVIDKLPVHQRGDLRKVDIVTLRPSRDLGKLASRYEARLPRAFRFMARGLGTRETEGAEFLSLLMFQPDYLRQLIALGEADAEARLDEIARLVAAPDVGGRRRDGV